MTFAEQLRLLQAAQGDPAKLALATVDLKYPELSETERATLKTSLEAAAIPHWCDEGILAALLEIPPEESAIRLAQLRGLTVVERFRARGSVAINVHEAARLSLRKAQAALQTDRFRSLSAHAAGLFQADPSPAGKIEWIYHLLCANPDRGADKLEMLDGEWGSSARPEDRYALAAALRELDDCGMVEGRARAWVLLAICWTAVSRDETTQQGEAALEILKLAKST